MGKQVGGFGPIPLTWSADGNLLAVGGAQVLLVHSDGSLAANLDVSTPANGVAFVPVTGRLAISDIANHLLLRDVTHPDQSTSVPSDLHPWESLAAALNVLAGLLQSGDVRVWDATTATPVALLSGTSNARAFALDSSGKSVLLGGILNELRLFSLLLQISRGSSRLWGAS